MMASSNDIRSSEDNKRKKKVFHNNFNMLHNLFQSLDC